MSAAAAKALLGDLVELASRPGTRAAHLAEVARQFREELETLRAPVMVHVVLRADLGRH